MYRAVVLRPGLVPASESFPSALCSVQGRVMLTTEAADLAEASPRCRVPELPGMLPNQKNLRPRWPCPQGWPCAARPPAPQDPRFRLPQLFWLQHLFLNQTGSLEDGPSQVCPGGRPGALRSLSRGRQACEGLAGGRSVCVLFLVARGGVSQAWTCNQHVSGGKQDKHEKSRNKVSKNPGVVPVSWGRREARGTEPSAEGSWEGKGGDRQTGCQVLR